MKHHDLINALAIIVDQQLNGCAPVEVSIGSISDGGIVQHGTLLIKNAPACIVNVLIEHGYSVSIGKNGAIVDYYKF